MKQALHEADGGIWLDVEVIPGARTQAFPAAYNPWRRRLQARVEPPAQDGAANEALVVLVAGFFDVPKAQVRIESGHRARQKRLWVGGVSLEEAHRRLALAG